jgi:hypothetical protein
MNQPERREVTKELKAKVLAALKEPDGYVIYKSGRDYLRRVGFSPLQVAIGDLVDYLEAGNRLYVLPDNPKKCECCLSYENNLVIFVKISPSAREGIFYISLDFHAHNTGYSPLPP